jgi:hypothetical protein
MTLLPRGYTSGYNKCLPYTLLGQMEKVTKTKEEMNIIKLLIPV